MGFMETVNAAEVVEISVQSFSPRGYGVGKCSRTAPLSQIEVEVAHALPQDRILIEMRRKVKGTRKGRLLEILEPSPDRVEPSCKHAQVCGGCCWQQMAYTAQLREKERLVIQAFGPGTILQPIIAAPQIFRYRNKMEFSFSENRAGMRYLGLMIAQAEPYVYNTEECHLCHPWFSDVLNATRLWWEKSGLKAYNPPKDEGTLRYITLREAVRTNQKMAILNVSGNADFAPTRTSLDSFVEAVRSAAGNDISLFLRVHQTKKGRPTQFYEMHLGGPDHIVEELHLRGRKLSFKISPSSFFQPNTIQAERLYDTALDLLAPFKPSLVYDLYCGTGTLGMVASTIAKTVIGIELSPEAVLDAEENLKRNGISNCTFLQGDVGKTLTSLQSLPGARSPDAVILDPPRAGLDPLALHHLRTLQPKVIIYVSCNPTTQAENIRELMRDGYKIQTLQPIDQFPHTFHIENIALLVR
jgi:23S rRNA (uracil1939-C5)-methyltransferase